MVLKRHGPAKLRIPTCRVAFGNVGSVCVHAQTHTEREKSSCKARGMAGMAGWGRRDAVNAPKRTPAALLTLWHAPHHPP